MSADESNIGAWHTELSRLEADIAWAEQDHSRELDPWAPTADIGPLPPIYARRARRIVDAQQRVLAALAAEKVSVTRHLAALRTVPRDAGNGSSVFLDRTA